MQSQGALEVVGDDSGGCEGPSWVGGCGWASPTQERGLRAGWVWPEPPPKHPQCAWSTCCRMGGLVGLVAVPPEDTRDQVSRGKWGRVLLVSDRGGDC